MFFRRAEKILPWMRPTYLVLSVFLGLLISVGAHVLIESWWLSYAQSHNLTITWTSVLGSCSLPLYVQIGLPILGAIGGFITGRMWWRWVYVERRWERPTTNNQEK